MLGEVQHPANGAAIKREKQNSLGNPKKHISRQSTKCKVVMGELFPIQQTEAIERVPCNS
jgi:hypothetical protein